MSVPEDPSGPPDDPRVPDPQPQGSDQPGYAQPDSPGYGPPAQDPPGYGPQPAQGPPGYAPPGYGPQPTYAPPAQGPPGYAPQPGYAPLPHDPSAPYGRHPATGEPSSDKQKIVAGLLQIFLGGFGAGRWYLGDTGIALGQLFTCGGLGIWALIDGIMILTGNVRDKQGRPLRG